MFYKWTVLETERTFHILVWDPSPRFPLQALTQARLSSPGPGPVHKEQVGDVRGGVKGAEIVELGAAGGGGEHSGKAGVGRQFSWPLAQGLRWATGPSSTHISLQGPLQVDEGSRSQKQCLHRSKGSRTEVMLGHQPPV